MANGERITRYTNILDEYLDNNLVSSVLDSANSNVIDFTGAGTVKVPKLTMDPLGNYDRATGFPKGEASITYEELELKNDRGREFTVDAMDDEETAFIRSASLMKTFMSRYVIPEVDAVRFGVYASKAHADNKVTGELTDAAETKAAIRTAKNALFQENATPAYLFVSDNVLAHIEDSIPRFVNNNDSNINDAVQTYNGMKVIPVRDQIFTANPSVVTSGFNPGKEKINFLIVDPTAVRQIKKHEELRVFNPKINQKLDAWLFQYRLYHDAFVLPGLEKGIYAHTYTETSS